MIYLHRVNDEDSALFAIAACEREASAQNLEARGYERCSYTIYRRLWALQDTWALEEMRGETETEVAPLARAVGGVTVTMLPDGGTLVLS